MQTSLRSNNYSKTLVATTDKSDNVATTPTTKDFIGQVRDKVLTTGKRIVICLDVSPDGAETFLVANDPDRIINALQPTKDELKAQEQNEKNSINKHKEQMELTKWRGRGLFATTILEWLKKNLLPIEK